MPSIEKHNFNIDQNRADPYLTSRGMDTIETTHLINDLDQVDDKSDEKANKKIKHGVFTGLSAIGIAIACTCAYLAFAAGGVGGILGGVILAIVGISLLISAVYNFYKVVTKKTSEVEQARQNLVTKSLHVINDSFEKDESYNLIRKQQDYITSQNIANKQDRIKNMNANRGLIEAQMDELDLKQRLSLKVGDFAKGAKNVNNKKVMNSLNTINSVGNAIG